MIGYKRIFQIVKKEIHLADYPRWNVNEVTVDHYVDIHKEILHNCLLLHCPTTVHTHNTNTQSKLNGKKKFDEKRGAFRLRSQLFSFQKRTSKK